MSNLVIITLTPLSNPGDCVRNLELSSTKNTIYIGRASKNETKGLLADRSNAWFDSPIMSRQHAALSMSSLPKVSSHANIHEAELILGNSGYSSKIVALLMVPSSRANGYSLLNLMP